MNGKCLDIGTIQAFLDGELRPEQAVSISDHVDDCDPCTILLAEADEENSLVFSVLDRELNALVPTQRLWSRINDLIAEEKSRVSVWQRFMGAASLLNPSFAAAAGILLMVGMIAVVWNSRSTVPTETVAHSGNVDTQGLPVAPATPSDSGQNNEIVNVADNKSNSNSKPDVVETKYTPEEIERLITPAKHKEYGPKRPVVVPASTYLPGEESYIKTIDELQGSVTAQNASMSASTQVSFARDVAVVDDAIAKMRNVVKKNPRNQAARQVLYSSYQDKIDLLKSSAQRDELMASLQD